MWTVLASILKWFLLYFSTAQGRKTHGEQHCGILRRSSLGLPDSGQQGQFLLVVVVLFSFTLSVRFICFFLYICIQRESTLCMHHKYMAIKGIAPRMENAVFGSFISVLTIRFCYILFKILFLLINTLMASLSTVCSELLHCSSDKTSSWFAILKSFISCYFLPHFRSMWRLSENTFLMAALTPWSGSSRNFWASWVLRWVFFFIGYGPIW